MARREVPTTSAPILEAIRTLIYNESQRLEKLGVPSETATGLVTAIVEAVVHDALNRALTPTS